MERTPFGTTSRGEAVERILLDNGAISVGILTYGATLQDLRIAGIDRSLTLGSPRLADYEPGGAFTYFGAIAGPVANRIARAATRFDGRDLAFEPNGPGGHHLHGGSTGLSWKVWQVERADEANVVLSVEAAHGEGSLPGNRRFEATFSLADGPSLTLTLRAETDAPTLVNLANHSYWNLSDAATFHGHLLQVEAGNVMPVDADALPTGEVLPVAGTAMDFRSARALTAADHLDNNFCLGTSRTALRPAASLAAPGGPAMTIETTEPGLQVYDARHMPAGGATGTDGRVFGPRSGVALEAQFWPDAPSHADFPSIRLDPGQPWEQVTRFTFRTA
ncbi:aldose epimerase family protein [Tropicimonas marinistellae]|uniref:aldose epimerase family protein n=1 Tax=Tropicimonas marinistellae TaxID=1739787 RepID=UPI0008296512|nr:aldose epimerase family protein [Tropicimonas marinistellae]